MASAIGAVDEIVREYLLFRGFVQTIKSFDQEKRDDKDRALKVAIKISLRVERNDTISFCF